jgi:hypothetical protein
MLPDATKNGDCGQPRQLGANEDLCAQRIDRSDLEASSATVAAKLGGGDVFLPFRSDEGKRRKSPNDHIARTWAAEPQE